MRPTFIGLLFAALILAPIHTTAAEFGTRQEAVAMVKRVVEQFQKYGAQETFKTVSDPSSDTYHDRDLYPFIFDMTGVNMAHGARSALVGKNLLNLKDQDGKYLLQEMIEVTNSSGSGWVDYKWPNPIHNRIEDKSSYVEKMGDYFVGVGVYLP